jgi:hypothetical protein
MSDSPLVLTITNLIISTWPKGTNYNNGVHHNKNSELVISFM